MIVALTGATGFVGGEVLRQLLDAGHTVRALTRQPQAARERATWIAGSLGGPAALADLCTGAEAVVHVAGVTNARDAAGFDAGNRAGTVAMLDAARHAGLNRFVHVSSLAAREPRLSQYGASKRAGEDAVVASALDWRIVRPPAVYGPGDTELLDMFRLARRGLVPLPPRGRLSVVHVEDLARFILALLDDALGRARYDADDGVEGGWSHAEFAHAIGAAVGRRVVALPLSGPLLKLGARLDRYARGEHAKLTADRVAYMVHPDWTVEADHRPPAALWQARIGTPAGLATTVRWYRDHGLL